MKPKNKVVLFVVIAIFFLSMAILVWFISQGKLELAADENDQVYSYDGYSGLEGARYSSSEYGYNRCTSVLPLAEGNYYIQYDSNRDLPLISGLTNPTVTKCSQLNAIGGLFTTKALPQSGYDGKINNITYDVHYGQANWSLAIASANSAPAVYAYPTDIQQSYYFQDRDGWKIIDGMSGGVKIGNKAAALASLPSGPIYVRFFTTYNSFINNPVGIKNLQFNFTPAVQPTPTPAPTSTSTATTTPTPAPTSTATTGPSEDIVLNMDSNVCDGEDQVVTFSWTPGYTPYSFLVNLENNTTGTTEDIMGATRTVRQPIDETRSYQVKNTANPITIGDSNLITVAANSCENNLTACQAECQRLGYDDGACTVNDSQTCESGTYAGTSYCDQTGVSGQNNNCCCAGESNFDPEAVLDLEATALDSETIELSWTPVEENVAGYIVYNADNDFAIQYIAHNPDVEQMTYLIHGLDCESEYSYYIRSVSDLSQYVLSDPSNIASATTLTCGQPSPVLTQPENINLEITGPNSANLTWDEVEGATGYHIFDCNGNYIVSTDTNSFSFNSLICGTQYCFYVVAHDGAGNQSEPSEQVSATTDDCAVLDENIGTITNVGTLVSTGSNIWVNLIIALVMISGIGYFMFRKKEQKDLNVDNTNSPTDLN